MTELEKYRAINQTKTLEELADVILKIADKGQILGRKGYHNAEHMANTCLKINPGNYNQLTQNYGIRQQGMMLYHYQYFRKDKNA